MAQSSAEEKGGSLTALATPGLFRRPENASPVLRQEIVSAGVTVALDFQNLHGGVDPHLLGCQSPKSV